MTDGPLHDLNRVVIVGASLAGLRAAETLRQRAFAGAVVVVGAETHRLKPYLRGRGRRGALVNRAVTYYLLALGEEADIDGERMFAIRSSGAVFAVMPMARLAASL